MFGAMKIRTNHGHVWSKQNAAQAATNNPAGSEIHLLARNNVFDRRANPATGNGRGLPSHTFSRTARLDRYRRALSLVNIFEFEIFKCFKGKRTLAQFQNERFVMGA